LKFGIALPNYGPTDLPESVRTVARAAEAAGYDSVWVSDHILTPRRFGPVFGRTIEPLLTLGYLAGLTEKVQLATSIIILPERDPILVAKQAAGVDQLSNGRMVLGIGVGWMEEQYTYFRADFRRRGRMADEWVKVIRDLWTADPSTFHGEFIHYHDAYFQPKPVQPNGPPIVVGGASPAALRRAATLCDGWHASGLGLADFAERVTTLREMAGGRPMQVSLRAYVSLGPVYEAAYRDNPDVLIGGSPQAFVDQIAAYREAGLDHLVCGFAHSSLPQVTEQLELFAAQVMPAFRS
jgi:probable F420-dependent oxidoreductase